MVDEYDAKHDRWLRRFRYPRGLRLLFVVPLLLAGAVVVLYTMDSVELVARARDFVEDRPRVGYAALGVGALVGLWCLWVSFRSWVSYILVTPSSIKHHIMFHGRQRISWEHLTQFGYKWRLLGHTILLYGSDGSDVSFRSSISGYDDLIALIHKNVSPAVRAQLEELLGDGEREAVEYVEEWVEEEVPADDDGEYEEIIEEIVEEVPAEEESEGQAELDDADAAEPDDEPHEK